MRIDIILSFPFLSENRKWNKGKRCGWYRWYRLRMFDKDGTKLTVYVGVSSGFLSTGITISIFTSTPLWLNYLMRWLTNNEISNNEILWLGLSVLLKRSAYIEEKTWNRLFLFSHFTFALSIAFLLVRNIVYDNSLMIDDNNFFWYCTKYQWS